MMPTSTFCIEDPKDYTSTVELWCIWVWTFNFYIFLIRFIRVWIFSLCMLLVRYIGVGNFYFYLFWTMCIGCWF
jgi:hypothetical protein